MKFSKSINIINTFKILNSIMINNIFTTSFVKGTAKTTASILVMGLFASIWYGGNYAYNSYQMYLKKKEIEESSKVENEEPELEIIDMNYENVQYL